MLIVLSCLAHWGLPWVTASGACLRRPARARPERAARSRGRQVSVHSSVRCVCSGPVLSNQSVRNSWATSSGQPGSGLPTARSPRPGLSAFPGLAYSKLPWLCKRSALSPVAAASHLSLSLLSGGAPGPFADFRPGVLPVTPFLSWDSGATLGHCPSVAPAGRQSPLAPDGCPAGCGVLTERGEARGWLRWFR